MLAKPGPCPAEFQSRIRAFTRVERSLPANLWLQDFTSCQSTSRKVLPGGEDIKMCLRHGSFIFADLYGDGEVVLKINQEQRKVQAALVQRQGCCLRHPRCVCYHVCHYKRQWKRMDEVTGTVLCLSPKLGWKHDFALSLQKVCWRRASVLGNARSEAITNGPLQPEVMRAAKLLDLCFFGFIWGRFSGPAVSWQALVGLGACSFQSFFNLSKSEISVACYLC